MSESRMRRLAAIDIGTVTTRLLIADVGPGSIDDVFRSTDITHLGEDLTATGYLSKVAMDRVADIISGYTRVMSEHGVEEYMAIATSASRDAANGDEFVELLASRGVKSQVVSGDLEAQLSFAGATSGTYGEGLYRWNRRENRIDHFSKASGAITDDWVLCAIRTESGLYFGTFGGGVSRFVAGNEGEGDRWKRIGLRQGLSALDISSATYDPPRVYFGTLGSGVSILDESLVPIGSPGIE